MSDAERDRIRALRWELKRKDTPARRKRCGPSTKQDRYRERENAGRRLAHVEIDVVAIEELLRGIGYDLPDGYTRRECDEVLAEFITMLAAATGHDARFENLLRMAIEIYNSGDIDP